MQDTQKEIGKRLQEIRNVYNNGFKASIEQFAGELGETKYNISNYESGKANIPNRLLLSLYDKGINPLYILTGEGSKFSDNVEGRKFKDKPESPAPGKEILKSNVEIVPNFEISGKTIDELLQQAAYYSAAAGDIMKIIKEKRKKN